MFFLLYVSVGALIIVRRDGHEVDQDGILQGWMGVVAVTMQPDAIGVWVGPVRDNG